MLLYEKLTLLRHGETWIYHIPKQRRVTITCPLDSTWVAHTSTLFGAGFIHNVTRCAITFGEIRRIAELHGVARAKRIGKTIVLPTYL
jgi:hypothetical protein